MPKVEAVVTAAVPKEKPDDDVVVVDKEVTELELANVGTLPVDGAVGLENEGGFDAVGIENVEWFEADNWKVGAVEPASDTEFVDANEKDGLEAPPIEKIGAEVVAGAPNENAVDVFGNAVAPGIVNPLAGKVDNDEALNVSVVEAPPVAKAVAFGAVAKAVAFGAAAEVVDVCTGF